MKRFTMLRIAAGLALSVCFGVLVACGSLPTLQKQFATGCTAANADLKTLSTAPQLNADQQASIAKVLAANQEICAAGVQLNVTSLKAFHDSLLPVAIGIVQATPKLPDQTLILIALQTFGLLVQQQIDALITTVAPAASAPVAASAP